MQDIYSKTAEVQIYLGESPVLGTISEAEQASWTDPPRTVWFGEGDQDRGRIIDFVARQQPAKVESVHIDQPERLRHADAGAFSVMCLLANGRCIKDCLHADLDSPAWLDALDALDHLMHRPWWRRAWVLQEAMLPEQATVTYGEIIAPLDIIERSGSMVPIHFERCCRQFFDRLPAKQEEILTSFGNHMAYLENIRHQHELFAEPQAVRLRELLQLTRLRDAFDGRDKVYALLGLMQHLPNQLPIVPDYSKTLSEVYVQTAMILITHFKTLDLLVTAQRKIEASQIPTWVPDWSSSKNDEHNDVWLHRRMTLFNAGPSPELSADVRGGRLLAVAAREICTVSAKAAPSILGKDDTEDRICEFAEMVRTLYNNTEMSYVTRGSPSEALCCTILGGIVFEEPNTCPATPRRYTAEDRLASRNWLIYHVNGTPIPDMLEQFDRSFWTFNDDRSFFLTWKGYMGLGPPDMRVGDKVFVVMGSRVPFILRPVERPDTERLLELDQSSLCYTLVGYCYVHGIMDGEVVADNEHDMHQIYLA